MSNELIPILTEDHSDSNDRLHFFIDHLMEQARAAALSPS